MAIDRRGQALMELACGMFALALVVSALCAFAVYIAKSLEAQNAVRTGVEKTHKIEFSSFAAEHVFGTDKMTVKESVRMPSRTILK